MTPEPTSNADRNKDRSQRMMFDIGEPSEASDQVAAMLDLNIDPLLNITS